MNDSGGDLARLGLGCPKGILSPKIERQRCMH